MPLGVKKWILNHWTAREGPVITRLILPSYILHMYLNSLLSILLQITSICFIPHLGMIPLPSQCPEPETWGSTWALPPSQPRDQSTSKSYDSAPGISYLLSLHLHSLGLPRWCSSKEPTGNAGDASLISEWERSPGGGNGNPLQDPCLEDSKDRGAWCAIVHGVAKSQTRLSGWAHKHAITFHQPTDISCLDDSCGLPIGASLHPLLCSVLV